MIKSCMLVLKVPCFCKLSLGPIFSDFQNIALGGLARKQCGPAWSDSREGFVIVFVGVVESHWLSKQWVSQDAPLFARCL